MMFVIDDVDIVNSFVRKYISEAVGRGEYRVLQTRAGFAAWAAKEYSCAVGINPTALIFHDEQMYVQCLLRRP